MSYEDVRSILGEPSRVDGGSMAFCTTQIKVEQFSFRTNLNAGKSLGKSTARVNFLASKSHSAPAGQIRSRAVKQILNGVSVLWSSEIVQICRGLMSEVQHISVTRSVAQQEGKIKNPK